MKGLLTAVAVIGFCAPLYLHPAAAQGIDPRCSEMRDKVACTCALQNGGQLVRAKAYPREGWKLSRQRDANQTSEVLDREKISFPAKFKWKGWKFRPSADLEGYMACMRRWGRK